MQEAIAIGLENAPKERFFENQLEDYTERRDILTSYFDQLGLSYTKPDGSYFLLVDMSPVKIPEGFEVPPSCQGRGKDFAFCWWLCQTLKVVGIPPSEVSKRCLCGEPLWLTRCSSTAWTTSISERGLLDSLS